MPDTPENQAESPQSRPQKPGVGLPIARGLAILSLATAAVLDVAAGPYSSQETSETALLRTRLESFSPGDLLVADRDFCSFFLLALLLGRGQGHRLFQMGVPRSRSFDVAVRGHQV